MVESLLSATLGRNFIFMRERNLLARMTGEGRKSMNGGKNNENDESQHKTAFQQLIGVDDGREHGAAKGGVRG